MVGGTLDDKVYVVPPRGDGAGSQPTSAGQTMDSASQADFQSEVNEKLDAILAALGIQAGVAS